MIQSVSSTNKSCDLSNRSRIPRPQNSVQSPREERFSRFSKIVHKLSVGAKQTDPLSEIQARKGIDHQPKKPLIHANQVALNIKPVDPKEHMPSSRADEARPAQPSRRTSEQNKKNNGFFSRIKRWFKKPKASDKYCVFKKSKVYKFINRSRISAVTLASYKLGTTTGVALGAAIGSSVPVVGTLLGMGVGAIIGFALDCISSRLMKSVMKWFHK